MSKTSAAQHKAEKKAREEFLTNKMLIAFGGTIVSLVLLMLFQNFVVSSLNSGRQSRINTLSLILYCIFGAILCYGVFRFAYTHRTKKKPESQRLISGYNICTVALSGLFCVYYRSVMEATGFKHLYVFLLVVGLLSVLNYIMNKEFYFSAAILAFGGMGMYAIRRVRETVITGIFNWKTMLIIGMATAVVMICIFCYFMFTKGICTFGKQKKRYFTAGFGYWQPLFAAIVVLGFCFFAYFFGGQKLIEMLYGAITCAGLIFLLGVYNAVRML